MNWNEELEMLFVLPLFADVRPATPKITHDDRLAKTFEEINKFFETYHRAPNRFGDTNEKVKCRELEAILKNVAKREYLRPFDKFNLLGIETPENELAALFNNPIFDIDEAALTLFDVPEYFEKNTQREAAEFKAQRQKCVDFELYDSGFKRVHRELKEGKRTLAKINKTANIKAGTYYLYDGVILLLNSISQLDRDEKGRLLGRTHCVFENGTETNILVDTLRRAIYKDGFVIQENNETDEKVLLGSFGIEAEGDLHDGYIYVLKSLSENPEITVIDNLYKIGFSTTPVEERIKNAANDPTYLMAKVTEVARWKTLNMNTHEFENIIHRVFDCVQLRIKVLDGKGNEFTPREWFVVSLGIIKNVMERIVDGSIVDYHYNQVLQVLEQNDQNNEEELFDTKGMAVLTLNVNQKLFDSILSGEIKEIAQKLKQSKINTYTWVENETGNRYLKKFDALRLTVGNQVVSTMIVHVDNVTYYNDSNEVIYSIGELFFKKVS